MSSSRQSSRSEGRAPVGRCPACGHSAVVRVTEDIHLTVGRRRYRFPAIEHERCTRCGERIFDLAASKHFDTILKRRTVRAA